MLKLKPTAGTLFASSSAMVTLPGWEKNVVIREGRIVMMTDSSGSLQIVERDQIERLELSPSGMMTGLSSGT